MMGVLRDRLDAFLGRGRFSTAVPVMDGPLQPNQHLERAAVLASAPALDNLVALRDGLYCSSGQQLMRIRAGTAEAVASYGVQISCMASDGGEGLAVGLARSGIVLRGGPHDGRAFAGLGNQPLNCPTAALFLDPDTLLVANGSAQHGPEQWQHDLMTHGCSGSVWKIKLATGHAELLAQDLAYPYGLALSPAGEILVSEAWRHRIVALDANKPAYPPRAVLQDLPGYPARLVAASGGAGVGVNGDAIGGGSGGGYWLAIFAPRNQLVEFVLQQDAYRQRMVASIEPRFWIAPALSSWSSFREPVQGGAIKQMGQLKPWAPSRSYGLVVRLGSDLSPISSWHSRADGRMHGVTSLCEYQGQLVLGAKGPGHALGLDLDGEQAR